MVRNILTHAIICCTLQNNRGEVKYNDTKG
jgi:hypothetical protein